MNISIASISNAESLAEGALSSLLFRACWKSIAGEFQAFHSFQEKMKSKCVSSVVPVRQKWH